MIAAELERGKVECSFYYELTDDAGSGTINEPVVKSYYEQLYRISGELGLETSLELLSTVMRMPDTIRTEKPELEEEEWNAVKTGPSAGPAAGKWVPSPGREILGQGSAGTGKCHLRKTYQG